MNHFKTYLILLSVLTISSSAMADTYRDAARSVEDAIDAVAHDEERRCMRQGLRHLEAAASALKHAKRASEVTRVADDLNDLASDLRSECELSTFRSVRNAARDVTSYRRSLERTEEERDSRPRVMSDSEFQALRRAIKDASYDRDRVKIGASALEHNLCSVDQLSDLLQLLGYDQSRLELVKQAQNSVVDRKKHGYKVASAFSYSSYGQKAVKLLAR